jgi:hypothetical protein
LINMKQHTRNMVSTKTPNSQILCWTNYSRVPACTLKLKD